MDTLIAKFIKVREAAGMNYAAVGLELGIAATTVGRWERNGTVRSGSARQAIQAFIDKHSGSGEPSSGNSPTLGVSSPALPGGAECADDAAAGPLNGEAA